LFSFITFGFLLIIFSELTITRYYIIWIVFVVLQAVAIPSERKNILLWEHRI